MTIWTILSAFEVVYVVVLSMWIVLEKRSPVSTLAWILVLALVPGLGLALYVFLGPRRIRRKRLRYARLTAEVKGRADALAPAKSPDSSALSGFDPQLVQLARRCTGVPIATCRDVRVYVRGGACFSDILSAIRGAKHHVHLEVYIFADDATGRSVLDALVERAKAGVQVRLLVDAVGSARLGARALRALRQAGGQWASFNRVRFSRLRSRVNFRNHRKIVVVDGELGFLGGMNVADEYNDDITKDEAYRDTHVRLAGAAVRHLQVAFLEDWTYATHEEPHEPAFFVPESDAPESQIVQILPAGPDQVWEPVQKFFFSVVTSAKSSVRVTTPYFVPDESMLTALVSAALRGVDVELVVPHRSDSRIVSAASRSYYSDLLRAGVRIYEYPKMLHAKALVVDDHVACIGSANMDNRSFRLNFEIVAVFFGGAALEVRDSVIQDRDASARVLLSVRRRLGVVPRLGEATARLLSPLL